MGSTPQACLNSRAGSALSRPSTLPSARRDGDASVGRSRSRPRAWRLECILRRPGEGPRVCRHEGYARAERRLRSARLVAGVRGDRCGGMCSVQLGWSRFQAHHRQRSPSTPWPVRSPPCVPLRALAISCQKRPVAGSVDRLGDLGYGDEQIEAVRLEDDAASEHGAFEANTFGTKHVGPAGEIQLQPQPVTDQPYTSR